MLTDTHTHLYSDHFNEDLSLVMQRAFDSGVKRFLFQLLIQQLQRLCTHLKNNIQIMFF